MTRAQIERPITIDMVPSCDVSPGHTTPVDNRKDVKICYERPLKYN